MIHKLKWKFIGIANASVFLVLIIVLLNVNLISYHKVTTDAYALLDSIYENDGSIPSQDKQGDYSYQLTPETRFETRYFILTCENGLLTLIGDHIAAVESDDLGDFANFINDKEDGNGMVTWNNMKYAYLRKTKDDGSVEMIFMDCTKRMYASHMTSVYSIYIGLSSMLLFFLILTFFSKKAIAPLVRNMEAQKQFITNASHELKTPLAVISANTEVMEMMDGGNEWTESTKRQVKRMSELVSQLVILSKLEEKKDIVLTDVDFSAQVEELSDSFRSLAETDGITLTSSIAPSLHVLAEERGSHELASILMDNALKYCDQGGSVEVSLQAKGKQVLLEVTNDYSQGKDVDYSKFFERFYREDQSHNSKKKGFGIGLSMASSLTNLFKGKINVNWKDGKIKFSVYLPAYMKKEKDE